MKVGYKPSASGQFIGGNIQKVKLNGSKAKAYLSKHKHHTTKHHKAKKIAKYKLDKK